MTSIRWEVVGGGETGGILVRKGAELSSEQLPTRLAKGAVIEQLDLSGERVRFNRISGLGPDAGWVSIRAGEKTLLAGPSTVATATPSKASSRNSKVSTGKVRVLCLHGYGSNSVVMKLGVARLKPLLGRQYELCYLDGCFNCKVTSNRLTPRGDFLDGFKTSSGGDWLGWFDYAFEPDDGERTPSVLLNDPAVVSRFVGVEKAADMLRTHITEAGPFDALVGFSQGALLMSIVESLCRTEDVPVPWKVSVVFCGLKIYDENYQHLFSPRLSRPAVWVDDQLATPTATALYDEPTILEHADGHLFPHTEPRASEVYSQVASEIKRYCQPGNG